MLQNDINDQHYFAQSTFTIHNHIQIGTLSVPTLIETKSEEIRKLLGYQCTPNDHYSSVSFYGWTFDANPSKVYSTVIADYQGIFNNKNVKVFQI